MGQLLDSPVPGIGLSLPDYWNRLNAEPVKRIARSWLGAAGAKGGKQQLLDALARLLDQPARMDAVRGKLSPFQHSALGLLARRGGMMAAEEFSAALLVLGHPYGSSHGRYPFGEYGYHETPRYVALNDLEDSGLVAGAYVPIPEADRNAVYLDRRDMFLAAYSDPRLLRGIEPRPPVPLPLKPLRGGEGGSMRRPADVSLRLQGLVEALRRQSPFKLTTRGRPPKPLITKLAKTLGWDKALESDPHHPLEDASQFFYRLLAALQLMVREEDQGYVATAADVLLNLPYPVQARLWGVAYASLTGWAEWVPPHTYLGQEELFSIGRFNTMRTALTVALGALPDPEAWYDFGEFEKALFDRIGDRVSLTHIPQYYQYFGASQEQKAAAKQQWQQKVRESWIINSAPFLQHALAGPLYHLGLVELRHGGEIAAGLPDQFRLTALGKVAFYDLLRPGGITGLAEPVSVATPEEPAWIIQPSFEIVAYLDRLAPGTIGFLGKIAERKPSEGAVAIYRLTREAVYAGLESGLTLPSIIEQLERGAAQPLPATVRRGLEDWAARRERISLYVQADLLEYADAGARDAALRKQPQLGTALGDRFVLVAPEPPPGALRGATVIDYLQPPVRCLDVAEDGRIALDPGTADFLIRGELAQWASSAGAEANEWQLSGESVGRAAQAGWTADQILAGLAVRSQKPLPDLVQVAVRAWARKRQSRALTGLERALVLQFADETTANAVGASELFRSLLGVRLGPRTYLVEEAQVEALQTLLDQFGLAPGTDLASFPEK